MPNRTMCNVLDEIRTLDKTRNYGPLMSLVEEVQIMGNRMEAKLYDAKDLKYARSTVKKLNKEIDELKEKRNKLRGGKLPVVGELL